MKHILWHRRRDSFVNSILCYRLVIMQWNMERNILSINFDKVSRTYIKWMQMWSISYDILRTSLLLCSFSVNTEYGHSRRLKYLFEIIKVMSLWYSLVLLRFLKNNAKKWFINLELSTLELERKKSHYLYKHVYKPTSGQYNNLA